MLLLGGHKMNIVDKIRTLSSERTITIAELERNLGLGAGTLFTTVSVTLAEPKSSW